MRPRKPPLDQAPVVHPEGSGFPSSSGRPRRAGESRKRGRVESVRTAALASKP
jgi:hypothetical protein